ncbi:endospore germination permease [Ectobacillus polymachus]|uniref:endospore germination permease n=1 Tax=Ectobacillus polymachus TaxID=1508806 RepID=UPI003A8BE59E
MKNADRITVFQLSFIVMTAIGFKTHVTIIPPLLQTAGRDAWMSVLFAVVVVSIWCILLFFIHKEMKQQHIAIWLKQHIGTFFTVLIIGIFCMYILTIASYAMRETMTWVKITFLPTTPEWMGVTLLAVLCLLTAASGLRTLSIINFFLLIMVIVFGFLVAIVNIQVKNYSLLLPILENGFLPVLKGSVYQVGALVELLFFLFLQQKIERPYRYRDFIYNILNLSFLTLGPLVAAVAEFGIEEAAKQRHPAYEEWGLVQMGQFIEHFDFLSIYQWMSGAYIRISLLLLILIELLNIKNEKVKKWVLVITFLIITIVNYIPFSDAMFYNFYISTILPTTATLFISFTFLLGIIAFVTRLKGGKAKNG